MTEQSDKKTYSVMVQGGEVKVLASTYSVHNGLLEFGVREGDALRPVASFPSWRWVMEDGVEVKS